MRNKTSTKWSPNFAYAIGLLVTDGNLSKDGRHLDLTSKDKKQIETFLDCLGLKTKIGLKKSSTSSNIYYHASWSDISFYRFLETIGLMPRKTKLLEELKIPDEYFFDFLRGHFDGDGTFYSYWDKRWQSSYLFYSVFISASEKHINWLRKKIYRALNIKGHLNKSGSVFQLKYAKTESLILLPNLYYSKTIPCLARKREKINKALEVINKTI